MAPDRRVALAVLGAAVLFFAFALAQRGRRAGSAGPPPPRFPAAMALTQELRDDPSPEARAFRTTCNRCHGLPQPSLFDEEGWRGVGETMGAHIRERGLDIADEEIALSVEYLVRHTTRK